MTASELEAEARALLQQAQARGDFAGVVAVMAAHPSHAGVQEHGSIALGDMTSEDDADARRKACDAGAIEAVTTALAVHHAASAALCVQYCRALVNVAFNNSTARVKAAACGAIEAVTAALLLHAAHDDVA
jgi:hypothetical protein